MTVLSRFYKTLFALALSLLLALVCVGSLHAEEMMDHPSSEVLYCSQHFEYPIFVGMDHVASSSDINEELVSPSHADGIRQLLAEYDFESIDEHKASGGDFSKFLKSRKKEAECSPGSLFSSGYLNYWSSWEAAAQKLDVILLGIVLEDASGFSSGSPGRKLEIRVESVLKGEASEDQIAFFLPGANFELWNQDFCVPINNIVLPNQLGEQVMLLYKTGTVAESCGLLSPPNAIIVSLRESAVGQRTSVAKFEKDLKDLQAKEIVERVRALAKKDAR